MPRYAAFLRAINVSGTRIAKDALCEPFRALGFENVTTFRASGNLVFDGPEASDTELARQIEDQLASDLGFTKATTFIRNESELRALADADPLNDSEGKLQVMLLLRRPRGRCSTTRPTRIRWRSAPRSSSGVRAGA